jgi:hypothetical protein
VDEICKIKCRCGKFQAELRNIKNGTRAICYCKDCQIYAYFLKSTDDILNEFRGTEVIAVRPQQISFKSGQEELSCVSLTKFGSLRWFSRCCSTPICNMSRKVDTSHISIIHSCLDQQDITNAFGNKSLHVKRSSAIGTPPENKTVYFLVSTLYYCASVVLTRLLLGHRHNPFIDPNTEMPIVSPVTLTINELSELMSITNDMKH